MLGAGPESALPIDVIPVLSVRHLHDAHGFSQAFFELRVFSFDRAPTHLPLVILLLEGRNLGLQVGDYFVFLGQLFVFRGEAIGQLDDFLVAAPKDCVFRLQHGIELLHLSRGV